MDMTNREYGAYVKAKAGRSPLWKDLILAFLVGGLICAGGQGLRQFYMSRGMDADGAGGAVSWQNGLEPGRWFPSQDLQMPWSPRPWNSKAKDW